MSTSSKVRSGSGNKRHDPEQADHGDLEPNGASKASPSGAAIDYEPGSRTVAKVPSFRLPALDARGAGQPVGSCSDDPFAEDAPVTGTSINTSGKAQTEASNEDPRRLSSKHLSALRPTFRIPPTGSSSGRVKQETGAGARDAMGTALSSLHSVLPDEHKKDRWSHIKTQLEEDELLKIDMAELLSPRKKRRGWVP